MLKVDLKAAPLEENFPGLRAGFPITSAQGTAATAIVYMELEPGGELPEHRDSAEELLLALEGEVEATLDGETGPLRQGEIAVVPSLAPHGLRNVSDRPARVLGFFGSATNVATFADFVFVVGAPIPVIAPLQEAAALTV